MNTKINQLINYGLENQMISLYDVDYSINMLLDLIVLKEQQSKKLIIIY